MSWKRWAVLAAVGLLAMPSRSAGAEYAAKWESLDTRPVPAWWDEARVGVFVVWGPYCVPGWAPKGQYAEWYGHAMRQKGSPTWKYHVEHFGEKFAYEQFGPMLTAEKWDPEAWADLFVRSGAKYVVFTANYHDGYCLWPSPYARAVGDKTWNAMEIGPKRDVLGEMFAAGRQRGLLMGIYYSLYEWFHPLWLSDRDRYVAEHFYPQFKDVVTRYRPACIFADGEWEMDYRRWKSEALLAWLFNESPVKDVVAVNDRWGNVRGRHGTFYESEYGGGNMSPTHPWQEDRGIGRSYGYNRNESPQDYDSRAAMLQMLTRCAGNGGNYLPCVGPKADGTIDATQQQRLLEMGQWLKANGEAIYGTKASPFWPRKLEWGACTYRPADPAKGAPAKLYLHVYGHRTGDIELSGLKTQVAAAWLLADKDKKPLKTRQEEAGTLVTLPETLPDEAVSVVVAELDGPPAIDRTIRQRPDGRVLLRAREAAIHGGTPVYESGGGKDNIGYWGDPKDSVSWAFKLARPGEFDVQVTYSCARGAGGSQFAVTVDGQSLAGTSKETGAWNVFKAEPLGRLRLDKPGDYTLVVQPKSEPAWKVIGLQAVTLTPAKPRPVE